MTTRPAYDPLEDIRKMMDANTHPVPSTLPYITKDSGQRESFPSGARRDVQDGKPRFDLVPVSSLRRLADLYARGAAKYGEHNWQKGLPFRRVLASLLRHVYAWAAGDREEDHLAAVAWNAFTLMAYQDMIKAGQLPSTLDDMFDRTGPAVRLPVALADADRSESP